MKELGKLKSKAFSGIIMVFLITSISTLIFNVQPVEAPGPSYTHGSVWLYRKAHNITGSTAGNQTYYQMKIIVHYGDGTDNGENVYLNSHSQTDFDDIRFTWYNSSSGSEVECDYWLEEKHDQDNATFWVEIPKITNLTGNTIYTYYGNPTVSTASNGTKTFPFFDHFLGSSLDTNKWYESSSDGNYSVSGSILTVSGGNTWKFIGSKKQFGTNHAFRFRAKMTEATQDQIGFDDRSATGSYHGTGKDEGKFGHGGYTYTKFYRNVREGNITDDKRTSDLSSWTTLEIRWSSSATRFYEDNILVETITTNVPQDNCGAWFAARYSTDVYCDWVFVRKYVDPEPAHGGWGGEEVLVPYVVIDQAFVSDERADVGSVQTIGFHAKWDNGSDVVGGEIYVNGTKYITNNAGWLFFEDVSSVVDRKNWIVTGVNCGGITIYTQTAPIPSIIWDQIKIVDGGVTSESVMAGETATIWFRAIYEYNDVFFEDTNGVLYVNGSEMTWGTANRWEYNYTTAVLGSKAFIITEASDNLYGLTVINDPIGAQTVTVLGQPTLTVSLDSSTTYVGYKVNMSGKLTHPDGTGISGAGLLLAYSVTDGETWNEITSVTTTAGGEYFVEWMPTATGNYLVKVSWEGNETLYLVGTGAYSTLAVTSVEEKYVFSVVSNSTVSELAFNSTSRILSFTVSGSSGTTGYTKVTIAKTLIGDINGLKVYLDGNQINYTVSSTDDSFLLYFTYQHSTHEVIVSLGPPPFIPPQLITPLSLSILAAVLAIATIILIFKIRRGTPPTILNGVFRFCFLHQRWEAERF